MSSGESDTEYDSDQLQTDASRSGLDFSLRSGPELPSQAPIPRVGPNKVQELVQDNQSLRTAMGITANSLSTEYAKMERFYALLKKKSQEMNAAFQYLRDALSQRDRANALLKADKVRLQQELMERKLSEMKVDEKDQINGEEDEKFKGEFDDTVRVLQQELMKSEEEKKNREIQYQQQFMSVQNTWKEWGVKLWNDYNKHMEQVQAEHNLKLQEQLREHEATEQSIKEQVTSLIKEIQGYQQQFQDKENELKRSQSQVGDKETRIYQLSRDAKSLEEQNRSMTESIIRLKQELEGVQRHRNDKEESLDQLFKVYNDEREKSQRKDTEISQMTEKLDKVFAQYLSAEESIKKKNEEIEALRDRLRERHRSEEQNPETEIGVWRQQAEVYKKDFEMEREAHVHIHKENMDLKKLLGQYEVEMQKLKTEIMKHHHQAQGHQFPPRS